VPFLGLFWGFFVVEKFFSEESRREDHILNTFNNHGTGFGDLLQRSVKNEHQYKEKKGSELDKIPSPGASSSHAFSYCLSIKEHYFLLGVQIKRFIAVCKLI